MAMLAMFSCCFCALVAWDFIKWMLQLGDDD